MDDHETLRNAVEDQALQSVTEEDNSETVTHLSDYSFDYDSDM